MSLNRFLCTASKFSESFGNFLFGRHLIQKMKRLDFDINKSTCVDSQMLAGLLLSCNRGILTWYIYKPGSMLKLL